LKATGYSVGILVAQQKGSSETSQFRTTSQGNCSPVKMRWNRTNTKFISVVTEVPRTGVIISPFEGNQRGSKMVAETLWRVSTAVFTSDLSLADQREQLLKLIADFSERLESFQDSEEKEIITARLLRLGKDLLQVEDALA
jgi:hypothetical protein